MMKALNGTNSSRSIIHTISNVIAAIGLLMGLAAFLLLLGGYGG